MKAKTTCKYYSVCGNEWNCHRCKGYEKKKVDKKEKKNVNN